MNAQLAWNRGLISFCFDGKEKRYMDHTVCAIYDGKRIGWGFSPAFELPQKIVGLMMKKGLYLSRATYESGLTSNSYVGESEGMLVF